RFPSVESMTMHDADFSILNNSLAIKSLYVSIEKNMRGSVSAHTTEMPRMGGPGGEPEAAWHARDRIT
ncbi:MAG: hypothetical protein WA970_02200, partial [Gammaproteobacteria bacterium]